MTTPAAVITAADNNASTDADARLGSLLGALVARRGVHHANVAIVGGDGRRWAGAAGAAGPDGAPLRPDTPFFVASVTKRFIITLVLQAHERGELDLAAPIAEYLPSELVARLHVHRGVDHTAQVTLRHLASHTSGLPDYFEKPREGTSLYRKLAAGEDEAWTFDDVIHRAKHNHRPHFAPQDLAAARQKARYSDTGFQVLIRILEVVTASSFDQLVFERISAPLRLEHTWLPGRSQPTAQTATPSTLYAKQRPLALPRMIESSNDLISTTDDLIRFQRALLAGDLFDSAATVEMLTERENLLRNAFPLRYGLGTMIFAVNRASSPTRQRMRLVGHSGSTGTWLFFCPELDVHLAGTVDQASGRSLPFRLMVRMLRAWSTPSAE